MANAAKNPKMHVIYRLFGEWKKQHLGGRDNKSVFQWLEENAQKYVQKGTIIKYTSNPPAIAICTPLMQRCHDLKAAGEVCYVDSTASVDAEGSTLTFLMAKSPAGGLPLGAIITDSQSTDSYTQGFLLLKDVISARGFNAKGFPALFMTDDSDSERNALAAVWPQSKQLLCQFHVSQSVWRWLWESTHGIEKVNGINGDFRYFPA